ncbi:MAG: type restriction enzyme subunit [Caldanaerobacter sp.]|uniref:restriction endonuclease subunit S n=1 Tax=Caldanaerobacter sp. TaxID=2930036 RepID=UPI0024AA3F8A|nr:restriction endonuclease subunit S [Caldanaerobacter sp.]MDI3519099.1 type restriction enzyme subunit [Caldanaerobacter sp.]
MKKSKNWRNFYKGWDIAMSENVKLPDGWKKVKLEEIAENTKFSIVDGPFGTQLHADEYVEDGEVPVIRVINLSYEGKFIKNDLVFISKDKANKLIRSRVIPGDIIIAKTGATIGKCGIFPPVFSEGIIASSCMKISLDKNKASNVFILYWLTSRYGQNVVINSALGTTRTTINITPFKNLELLLPPLPEQRKIAEILETIDNAIEKTDAIIEKYKRIKQGLMQDLLTKGVVSEGEGESERWRLRDENIDKFKDSLLGRIPEEWEVVRLGEIGKIITGSTPSTENLEYYGDEYLFVSPEDIRENKYITDSQKKLSELGFRISRKIPSDSICVVCIGSTIGKIAITKTICTTNQQINSIVPNSNIFNSEALFYFIVLYSQKPLKQEAGLQAVPIVNKNRFSRIQIPLPPLHEQQRIASILSQIDEVIEKEQAYKEKLERIKKGLMEDLLTGKVRVNHLIEEEEK